MAAVHCAFLPQRVAAVPTSKVKEVAAMLKAIHAHEDRAAARQKAEQVAAKLKEMKLGDAATLVTTGIEETLVYYAFPREHWRCLRTNTAGTNPARSTTKNSSGRGVPGWEVSPDVSRGQVARPAEMQLELCA